jgi:hypothetical protein
MKRLALILTILATPALALDTNWNGDPEPEPPTVTPEPPRPVDPGKPTESWADRNTPKPMSRPLPCCIRDGQLVTTPFLFMSHERALKVCERAKATGSALIYECLGAVSPEAVK